jgi:AraC family transcriptional regulator
MAPLPRPPVSTIAPQPSRVLFESRLVQVGKFRCPTAHPRFSDTGPVKGYRFVFPRTAVWIQHEGGRPFVADSTIVPLYNPGLPYRRGPISRDGDRTDWFGVSPEPLREALGAHGSSAADAEHRLFRHDYAPASSQIFFAQRRVFEHVAAQASPDPLYVEEAVLAILDRVLSGVRGGSTALHRLPSRASLAERVRAHLNVSYADGEDLTALAASVGASVFHLCRVFKQHTGQTLHGYRNQLRLRRSLELLGHTEDILSVALTLGYSGHSHFTAAFHRVFGTTPSAFRALSRSRRAAFAAALVAREQSAVNRRRPH